MRVAARFSLVMLLTGVALFAFAGASSSTVASRADEGANLLDCNGFSSEYAALKPGMKALCTDPFASTNGTPSRFTDNGWYVGHDEPSVKFLSNAPKSANTMTYYMQLAVDPAAKPTTDGRVSDYAELSPAPWYGLPICDPHSYPQNGCTADSDSNTGLGASTDAGSAFMELQFYPPGFGPFNDAVSCDQTHYCSALNIDSLECTYGFANCNTDCEEPVNFAYVTKDGVPDRPSEPAERRRCDADREPTR